MRSLFLIAIYNSGNFAKGREHNSRDEFISNGGFCR